MNDMPLGTSGRPIAASKWNVMALKFLNKIGADTSRTNDVRDLARLLSRVDRRAKKDPTPRPWVR